METAKEVKADEDKIKPVLSNKAIKKAELKKNIQKKKKKEGRRRFVSVYISNSTHISRH